MPKVPNILLVEDEENFGSVLKNYLELNDYRVSWQVNGNKGLAGFRQDKFDLCLLDVMMPERDGFSLAEEIKKIDPTVPIIFLTAKTQKQDILRGYGIGADDYISKPFDTEVLLCKIKALLNRNGVLPEVEKQDQYTLGTFTFHPQTRELYGAKEQCKLSPKEGALLEMLCEHINDVLPRERALNEIWKDNSYFTTRSMDVHIAKLRKYLSSDLNIEIVNVHGSGYRLMVPLTALL